MGGNHYAVTSNIKRDTCKNKKQEHLLNNGGVFLCERVLSPEVRDQIIQAGKFGDFFKHLGKVFFQSWKEKTQQCW